MYGFRLEKILFDKFNISNRLSILWPHLKVQIPFVVLQIGSVARNALFSQLSQVHLSVYCIFCQKEVFFFSLFLIEFESNRIQIMDQSEIHPLVASYLRFRFVAQPLDKSTGSLLIWRSWVQILQISAAVFLLLYSLSDLIKDTVCCYERTLERSLKEWSKVRKSKKCTPSWKVQ